MKSKQQKCRHQRVWELAYGWTPEMFTYIISCEGAELLKFGKSAKPMIRLGMLQTGCPFKLDIAWVWPEDIEQELHTHFAGERVLNEWFAVPLDRAIAVAAKLSKEKCKLDFAKTTKKTV